jgi:predicted GNAT family N-acyltransferase
MMKIQTIQWQEALPVRHKVLWPTKTELFCKVDGDENAIHYGAYLEGKLVCVASVYMEGRVARLRKFATLVEFQGGGIGSKLIAHILNELEKIEIELFWCDARASAVGFYKRFGMEIQGGEFDKSGISYFKMEVCLR